MVERYPDFRGKALLFLLFLWFIWFSNFSVRIVFSPILPILEDEFMVSHARASAIFIFLSTGYGMAVVFSGLFSGRYGYKRTIVFSLVCLSAVTFLIPFIGTFSFLYFFALLLGFSVGLYIPSAIPLITEYYAERNWGKVIAFHDTGASGAIFATPFIALLLLHLLPWRGIFFVYGCIFLACSIVFLFVCSEVRISGSPWSIFRDIIRIPSLWLMAAIWVFGAGANLGIYAIVPLYLTKELHMDIGHANTLLGISRLVSIGVAIACGFLVDRFNLRKIMFVMVATTGISTILLGLVPARHVGLVLFMQALFVTGFFPVGLLAIARTFKREMRGLATGVILCVSMIIGGGIVPYLLGISGDLYSFRLGIAILGVLVTLVSVLVFRLKELE